jgi:hypothetical protein
MPDALTTRLDLIRILIIFLTELVAKTYYAKTFETFALH